MNVFIDTWGWIAIADENDSYHSEATTVYNDNILRVGNSLYTSDFVLLETLTFLRQRIGHPRAVRWIQTLGDRHFEQVNLGFRILR